MDPNELYLYTSYERGLELIKTQKLVMKRLDQLNDPFEALPKTKYTQQIVNSHALNAGILGLIHPFVIIGLPTAITLMLLEYIVKKAQAQVVMNIRNIMNYYRVCSFSESENNILLWAYYGRDNTGIMFTFRNEYDLWGCDTKPIKYSNERIKVPFLSRFFTDSRTITKQWQWDLLLTKAECWSQEKEWRLIKEAGACQTNENGSSFITLDRVCFKRVTLGCRMEEKNQQEIASAVHNCLGNVPIRNSRQDNKNYLISSTSNMYF